VTTYSRISWLADKQVQNYRYRKEGSSHRREWRMGDLDRAAAAAASELVSRRVAAEAGRLVRLAMGGRERP
jgi:hypothetical protein